MAEASIPVDLFNPGQVFACLGFLEVADVLLGDAEGGFDWSTPTAPTFKLRVPCSHNPVAAALEFICQADLRAMAPPRSSLSTQKWNVPTDITGGDGSYPFATPQSPATLPVVFRRGDQSLVVDHWGDSTNRDNVKFWAGAGGYPGAALMRDALDSIRDRAIAAADDPFSLCVQQSSSFRFDWRQSYIAIDTGFALNDQPTIMMTGYPLVEIFAAIGLSHARPKRISKLEYVYVVFGNNVSSPFLEPALIRAGLGSMVLPFCRRVFRMHLDWPGKENQARCITTVTEEISK